MFLESELVIRTTRRDLTQEVFKHISFSIPVAHFHTGKHFYHLCQESWRRNDESGSLHILAESCTPRSHNPHEVKNSTLLPEHIKHQLRVNVLKAAPTQLLFRLAVDGLYNGLLEQVGFLVLLGL